MINMKQVVSDFEKMESEGMDRYIIVDVATHEWEKLFKELDDYPEYDVLRTPHDLPGSWTISEPTTGNSIFIVIRES